MIDEVLPGAFDGERLDRVVSMLDGCSRSMAAQLIEQGAVAVDGSIVRQKSFRVEGDMRVSFEPVAVEQVKVEGDEGVEFDVVHVDDDIVVVNKPPGLVVHPGAGRPDATMANGLVARFPEIAAVGDPARPGIVHRLDADTSGLLVVARSEAAYPVLVEALSLHEVERVYAAVVLGQVVDDRGVIDAPIGRSTRNRTRMAVVADGRHARTHYQVLARSAASDTTWLRCRLETGRTHQIRVHLAAIDHPVIGDRAYGARAGSAYIDRVCLHAHELAFEHPTNGEPMRFQAPIPPDFERVLAATGLVGSVDPSDSD